MGCVAREPAAAYSKGTRELHRQQRWRFTEYTVRAKIGSASPELSAPQHDILSEHRRTLPSFELVCNSPLTNPAKDLQFALGVGDTTSPKMGGARAAVRSSVPLDGAVTFAATAPAIAESPRIRTGTRRLLGRLADGRLSANWTPFGYFRMAPGLQVLRAAAVGSLPFSPCDRSATRPRFRLPTSTSLVPCRDRERFSAPPITAMPVVQNRRDLRCTALTSAVSRYAVRLLPSPLEVRSKRRRRRLLMAMSSSLPTLSHNSARGRPYRAHRRSTLSSTRTRPSGPHNS